MGSPIWTLICGLAGKVDRRLSGRNKLLEATEQFLPLPFESRVLAHSDIKLRYSRCPGTRGRHVDVGVPHGI